MTQGELLVLLAIHLLLTGLPGAAAALFAARRGERRVPVLLAVGLVASGAAAMVAFWSYYGGHELGQTVSFFIVFASVAVTGWCLYDGDIDRALLGQLATPLALWALGSAFLLYLGFFHGGSDQPLAASATRFSGQLPFDNNIPLFFSDWFFKHGHNGTPPVFPGEWLASDRPPLQVGYAVFERTFGWDTTGLHYQVMGIVVQQLWIVGLWALLCAGGAGRVTKALTMLTVLVSGLALVNGFFVWPKLLPAAMLLAAAALVLTPLWEEVRGKLWGGALFAALLGLAMLGHGASVFAVIPLLAIAAWRGLPSWRWLGVAAAVGLLFMAPWSAYQKYGDPPGNRLTKWMIGGVIDIDDRGTMETIVDSYEEVGFGGALHAKGQNFVAITGGKPTVEMVEAAQHELEDGHWSGMLGWVRTIQFLNLLPSLGPLLLGFAAMAVGWRRRGRDPAEWGLAVSCLLAFVVGAVAWALLLFGGTRASTVIHQGSLAIPILGIAAAAVGARAVFPRFGAWLLGVNAVLMLAIYVPSLEPLEGSSYSPWAGVLAAAFLAAFLWVAIRREPAPRTAPVAAAAE
ncbi:MAG: hypothetical protein ACTHNY_04025 [Solirubrobacterales bacterium]